MPRSHERKTIPSGASLGPKAEAEEAVRSTKTGRLPIGRTQGYPCQPVGIALRATKGGENPRGSGGFDDARKGWPGGQPRTRGSALL
jgi:hypothetical protein